MRSDHAIINAVSFIYFVASRTWERSPPLDSVVSPSALRSCSIAVFVLVRTDISNVQRTMYNSFGFYRGVVFGAANCCASQPIAYDYSYSRYLLIRVVLSQNRSSVSERCVVCSGVLSYEVLIIYTVYDYWYPLYMMILFRGVPDQ